MRKLILKSTDDKIVGATYGLGSADDLVVGAVWPPDFDKTRCNMIESTVERIGTFWCRMAHDDAMWPIHGQYECRKCGRHYPALVLSSNEITPRVRVSQ